MRWVLIADDSPDLRSLLADVLTERGYEVELAEDGADVVRLLDHAAEMPCALVLDLLMPRVGGLDVLRAMRSLERTRHVPAIILSGVPIDDEQLAGLDVSAVFLKPVPVNVLCAAIDRASERASRTS